MAGEISLFSPKLVKIDAVREAQVKYSEAYSIYDEEYCT
jgi:hypothetical protein